MSIFTRDKVWLSADRTTYLEYDPGARTVYFYVEGVLVGSFPYTAQNMQRRVIVPDGSGVTLTAADSGGLIVFDKTDGALINLPTAVAGMYYDFIVDTALSSGSYKVLSASASEFLKGRLISIDTDTSNVIAVDQIGNGSTHRAITMNGTTTGGMTGTQFRLTAISSTIWSVQGYNLGSGTVATPFATS